MSLSPANPIEPFDSSGLSSAEYIQPTLRHGLRIWWAFYWRNFIISGALGIVLALIVDLFVAKRILPLATFNSVVALGYYVLSYLSAIFVIHWILSKKFKDFRLGLISISDFGLLPLTYARSLRVWWVYCWRSLVYGIVLSFIANLPLSFISGAVQVMFPALSRVFGLIVQFLIAAAVGLFVIYSNVLDEEIGEFRVTLVPPAITSSASAIPNDPLGARSSSQPTAQ